MNKKMVRIVSIVVAATVVVSMLAGLVSMFVVM